jgi:glucose/arabinose dehydrogenase
MLLSEHGTPLGLLLLTLAALTMRSGASAAQDRIIETETGPLKVEAIAQGLDHPWGLSFLPDGRMLVTERPGRLRIVAQDGTLSEPLQGLPEIAASGQGGLLDVTLDPDFKDNRLVYFSFSEPGDGGASTAVARGRLGGNALDDVELIYRQVPKTSGGNHFGGRLLFSPDGKLFVTQGERFKFDPAQDLASGLGKIVRINPDGSIPADNPFVGQTGARPEIWSYGHRNVQGAAIDPTTGKLWTHEFGPLGGDELNLIQAGRNYGWPLVSWGKHYDGSEIPDPPTRPDLTDAVRHWTPVISPSGMTFYTADTIDGWRGNILIGGLSSQGIVRLTLDGDKVTGEERIPLSARIRNVRQGPDGSVYALTDESNGKILKLSTDAPPG